MLGVDSEVVHAGAGQGETAEEIAGLAKAMRAKAVHVSTSGDVLDIVGTGGDGIGSVNISTGATVIAAAAGARVWPSTATAPCPASVAAPTCWRSFRPPSTVDPDLSCSRHVLRPKNVCCSSAVQSSVVSSGAPLLAGVGRGGGHRAGGRGALPGGRRHRLHVCATVRAPDRPLHGPTCLAVHASLSTAQPP